MFTDPTDIGALWPICAPLHRVLLNLAGRMPDDWLARERDALAGGELADLPDTIAGSVITVGVPLTDADVTALRAAQAVINGPGQDDLIDRVTVVAHTPATGHAFAATGTDRRLDLLDATCGNWCRCWPTRPASRPADPAERRDLLARFAVDQAPAGVPGEERASLADMARRSGELDGVYLVLTDDVAVPLAWAPDSDRMVVLFE